MAVATLVSRITGLLRTMVLVAAIGVTLVGDAYNTANTLPNIVYELLLGGVLTSVIVPLLVHAQERDRDGGAGVRAAAGHPRDRGAAGGDGAGRARRARCSPGSTASPTTRSRSTWPTGWPGSCCVEIVFYGIGALAQAILNSRDVFGPPAWAPVLNNVVVIATGLLFIAASGPGELTPATITPGPGLAARRRHHRWASPSRRSCCCRCCAGPACRCARGGG